MAKDEQQRSFAERKWSPDPASRCQRVEPYYDPERGWAKPNGTIGCDIPEHGVNQPGPGGLSTQEWVSWNVDHAPPLSPEQKATLRALLTPAVETRRRSGT